MGWLSTAAAEFRFAIRTLARRPAFAALAVLTLAFGIGATTGVFSIVNAVLLRPLPYRDPGRLVAVWITSAREQGLAKIFATWRDFTEFQRDSRSFENLTAATWATRVARIFTGAGPAREVLTIPVTASFFDTLGVQAEVGRTFLPEDFGRGCRIVVSYAFWASTLFRNHSVVGHPVTLDRKPCVVLGVVPKSFGFYPPQTQAWALLAPGDQPQVGIFARLRSGVTIAQAQSELRNLYRGINKPSDERNFEPVVYGLHGEFTFLAGRTLRKTLLLAFCGVLFVLLIACLNVANLLLSRVSERKRELAIRAALGSGRARLIRQLLTEALLLSFASAVLGIWIAWFAVRVFRSAGPIELTVGADVRLSALVLVMSIVLSIATTIVSGLLPAIKGAQVDVNRSLKAGGRGAVEGRRRAARVVIAVEMAVSFVLLVGAGLLMASALRMRSEPLGFSPEHLLVTRVSLPDFNYGANAARTAAYRKILDGAATISGVNGVALASRLPPEGGGNQILDVQGRNVPQGAEIHDVGTDAVSTGFFEALQIPVRQGRVFDSRDRENSQPVAVINEALAGEYFPGSDPVGQQIRIAGGSMPWLSIIGVVGNVKHTQLMNEMSWSESPVFYRPMDQAPPSSVLLAVSGSGNAVSRAVETQIAARIADTDASIPLSDIQPFDARLARALAFPRFRAVVLVCFALFALALSSIGLHGVLSQLVVQRTAEFGIRRAVGAQTGDVLWMVARQGGAPVLAGLACGILATLAFSRVLESLLYGIQPADPRTIVLVCCVLLVVASVAIYSPARRAASIDPMAALREE